MKKEVDEFLESGLLEEYLMGICDEATTKRVEYYIEQYPEVKSEYDDLQDRIEKASRKLAMESPSGLKEAIISCINDESQYKLKSDLTKSKRGNLVFIPWAAAIIGLIATVALFVQKEQLRTANMEIYAQKNMLESQLSASTAELFVLREKLALSGHSKTERIVLTGNELSPEFNSTIFWNDVAGKAIVYINELGQLDENHCYQIWADVDGEMRNAGTLPHKEGPVELKHLYNATSLNITIEPKGGSEHPNVDMLISSQPLIKI